MRRGKQRKENQKKTLLTKYKSKGNISLWKETTEIIRCERKGVKNFLMERVDGCVQTDSLQQMALRDLVYRSKELKQSKTNIVN